MIGARPECRGPGTVRRRSLRVRQARTSEEIGLTRGESTASGDRSEVRVAVLGCGTVGTEVVRLLTEQADELTARIGAPVRLAGVAVRRPHRHPWLTERFG